MAESRRRLSPDDRRNELLALGAEVFGGRPYDDVRIDEIAERAGVSRALMYHYFPDKRTFFAAVVRAEGERLFEATNTPPQPGQSLFDQVREGVLAYLRYDEEHPHGAWAAYIGIGASDPILLGIEGGGEYVKGLHFAYAGGQIRSLMSLISYLGSGTYRARYFGVPIPRTNLTEAQLDEGRAFAGTLANQWAQPASSLRPT